MKAAGAHEGRGAQTLLDEDAEFEGVEPSQVRESKPRVAQHVGQVHRSRSRDDLPERDRFRRSRSGAGYAPVTTQELWDGRSERSGSVRTRRLRRIHTYHVKLAITQLKERKETTTTEPGSEECTRPTVAKDTNRVKFTTMLVTVLPGPPICAKCRRCWSFAKEVGEQMQLRLDELGEDYQNLNAKVITYSTNKQWSRHWVEATTHRGKDRLGSSAPRNLLQFC